MATAEASKIDSVFVNSFAGSSAEDVLGWANHLLKTCDPKQTDSLADALRMRGKHKVVTVERAVKGLIVRLLETKTSKQPTTFHEGKAPEATLDHRLIHHQAAMHSIPPKAFEKIAELHKQSPDDVRMGVSQKLWRGEAAQ